VPEIELVKLARAAMRETIEAMLKSARIRSSGKALDALRSNPYLKKEEAAEIDKTAGSEKAAPQSGPQEDSASSDQPVPAASTSPVPGAEQPENVFGEPDEEVSSYLKEHADEIAAEGEKPFQAIGGIMELLGADYFPVTQTGEAPEPASATVTPTAGQAAAKPAVAKQIAGEPKRQNTLQKINSLDVKGRIQLALKGNKEERSILIRDGTKVVALAVLEAPKLADGEVEKFASQKNVLEAVLRQIPLKRRFMKNYIVVRNLAANPRAPIDIGLGLMKNLLAADLKNLSNNKEVSETIRKLALKMYKQKLETTNKK
jgi:hypothetical protein